MEKLEKQLEFEFMKEMRKEDEREAIAFAMRRSKRDDKIACITLAIAEPILIGAIYLGIHPGYIETAKEFIKYLFN